VARAGAVGAGAVPRAPARALLRIARGVVIALLALLALAVPHAPLAAQRADAARPRQLAWRADAMVRGDHTTLHGGVGIGVPLSTYVRLETVAAAGALLGSGASARVDALARFVLDPFRQLARGPYAAAGVSVRREAERTRGDLVALLGVEGRGRQGYVPAVELGLGGGVRLGVVFRQARPNRR
jgi:hypothetical protein